MTKVRMLVLLIAAAALIFVLLALQLLAPGDAVKQDGPNASHIVFSADHGMLFAPGNCVVVRWQVDYIQAIYIDGTPTVGADSKLVCPDSTTVPTLRVEFTDNSSAEYTLNIAFLVEQPSTWLLIGAVVLLAVAFVIVLLSKPAAAASDASGANGRRTPRLVLLFAAVGIVISALLLLALVLELGVRFYFGQFGTVEERRAYLDSRAKITADLSSTIPLPFVEYGLSPDYPGSNALGYRGDEIQVPKPDGVFRIIALGDSETYGTTNPNNQSYPYLLQQILRDEYGYANVEVVNAGVFGYTSWNTLADLTLRGVGLQPNLVIVNEGGNDVIPREVSPDCYSRPSPFLGLDPRREIHARPADVSSSALYRLVAIHFGWMKNPAETVVDTLPSTVGCDAGSKDDVAQNIEANAPIYFERNIRSMIGVAQAHHFPIMFTTYAYNPNSPYAYPYWRAGVAEDNVVTARVAQETGVLFLDYAAIAPTDAEFWNDSIHMTGAGNRNQAEAVARFLVDHGVLSAHSG